MARKKWKPPRDRIPRRTLYDPEFQKCFPDAAMCGYADTVYFLFHGDDRRFHDSELAIFDDVVQAEQQLCAIKGLGKSVLAGPLTLKIGSARPRNLEEPRQSYCELPPWIEADSLEFQSCRAKGILLIEKGAVFYRLWKTKAWRDLNLVLACGMGIPRWRMRRVLHRLSTQFRIPVYVLADNDTWGYFIFSVLKRGMMGPHESCPQLAVKDVRFLGMRAHEYKQCGTAEECLIPWKRRWDLRLKFMRKYPCFRSKAWQREFDEFKTQNAKCEIECMVARIGEKRTVNEYLLPKLKAKNWLT